MPTAADVFAQANLYTDDFAYTLIHLPPAAITPAAAVLAEIGESFSALIADKDEVTLLLAQDDWAAYQHRLPDHKSTGPYRLITFDLELDPNLIGFMALVCNILADAGISILAFGAFSRDHIFVNERDFKKAWDTLQSAQAEQAG